MKKEETMKDITPLSFKEEVGNVISHGAMAFLLLILLPFIALFSFMKGSMVRFVTISIYVICIFLMFLISSIYHSMQHQSKQKYVFRRLDHIAIYLAIAGSYTPILMCLTKSRMGYIILVVEWMSVIAGIILKSVCKKVHPILSMSIYMIMGWVGVFLIPTLLTKPLFMAFILIGGIFYTVGAYFYSKEYPYYHFIWHIFIDLASITHMIAIIFIM